MSRQSAGIVQDDLVVIRSTEANISLTEQEHAGRIVVLNLASTDGQTITLPKARGSGHKYTIINNVAQTQSILITASTSADVMSGVAILQPSTAVATSAIISSLATATDYRMTWKGTDGTTGGTKGDMFEAWDIGANLWLVRVLCRTTGAAATPFS